MQRRCPTVYVCPCWSMHCWQDSGDKHRPWCKTVPPVQKHPSVGMSIQDDSFPLATDQSPGNVCMLTQSSTQPVRHASYSMEVGHCIAVNGIFQLRFVMQTCKYAQKEKTTYGKGGGSSSPRTRHFVYRGARRQR